MGFPGGSVVKNAGDTGGEDSIPGLGRSHGEGMATHSSILAWRIPWTEAHYSWWAIVHRVIKSQTQLKQLSKPTPAMDQEREYKWKYALLKAD